MSGLIIGVRTSEESWEPLDEESFVEPRVALWAEDTLDEVITIALNLFLFNWLLKIFTKLSSHISDTMFGLNNG